MKQSFFSVLLCVLMCFCGTQKTVANSRALHPCINTELPDDYLYQKKDKNYDIYYSPYQKTLFLIRYYKFSELPSGWSNPKKFDKNVLHLDTLECLSDSHSYFWQLNKSFCTRSYASPDGVIYSDTRCIYPSLLINTLFIDYTGQRSDVFDTYISSMTSHENIIDQLIRVVTNSYWFWIVLLIFVSIYGAVQHSDNATTSSYLKSALWASLAVGALLFILMYGQWAAIGIFMIAAFMVSFLASLTGVHLTMDD